MRGHARHLGDGQRAALVKLEFHPITGAQLERLADLLRDGHSSPSAHAHRHGDLPFLVGPVAQSARLKFKCNPRRAAGVSGQHL
ncbi:MAG TPA: hypothetical protein VEY89_11545, partial [Candidatus Dormibacteraeota bacterium]|nr:hypothetical protein [Candidatus Dormibacteraeota bacterium]